MPLFGLFLEAVIRLQECNNKVHLKPVVKTNASLEFLEAMIRLEEWNSDTGHLKACG